MDVALSQSDLAVEIDPDLLEKAVKGWDSELSLSQVEIALDDREDFKETPAEQSARFGPRASTADLTKLLERSVPKNTKRNTSWGLGVFKSWREHRIRGGDPVPDLLDADVKDLDRWLPLFLVEARRQDGSPYPPNTLYLIMCALQR